MSTKAAVLLSTVAVFVLPEQLQQQQQQQQNGDLFGSVLNGSSSRMKVGSPQPVSNQLFMNSFSSQPSTPVSSPIVSSASSSFSRNNSSKPSSPSLLGKSFSSPALKKTSLDFQRPESTSVMNYQQHLKSNQKESFNPKKFASPQADLVYTFPSVLSQDKMVNLKSMPLFCFYSQHENKESYVARDSKIVVPPTTSQSSLMNNVNRDEIVVQLFPFVTTDFFKNECYCFCLRIDNQLEKVAIVFESSLPIYDLLKEMVLEMFNCGIFDIFLNKGFREEQMRNQSTTLNNGSTFPNDDKLPLKKAAFQRTIDMLLNKVPIPAPSRISSVSFRPLKKKYSLRFPDVEELPFCNKIILVSDSVALMTYCAEALRILLYPFQFPLMFAFIPHLPVQLLETILSPVPYIVGVHGSLKRELFSVIEQQNRMFEQTAKISNGETEHDKSLIVLDIDNSMFLYGKSPEREFKFPEPYRFQLIEKLKIIQKPSFKTMDFLQGAAYTQNEQNSSTDTKIREAFTSLYCKLLSPLNIHILTRKWVKKNKRNENDYIDNIKKYVTEEAEDIDIRLKEFLRNLFNNQIFSELLNHGMEEQYFYQELCFSIFVNREMEQLVNYKNLILPSDYSGTNTLLDFDVNLFENSIVPQSNPNDSLLLWIENKIDNTHSLGNNEILLNYVKSRLVLMRAFIYERKEQYIKCLEDTLECITTCMDERLIKREWFESIILRIPKKNLSQYIAKMKTQYIQTPEDNYRLSFLEKIIMEMHQSHVTDVKSIFEQSKTIDVSIKSGRRTSFHEYLDEAGETDAFSFEENNDTPLASSLPNESIILPDDTEDVSPSSPPENDDIEGLQTPLTKRRSLSFTDVTTDSPLQSQVPSSRTANINTKNGSILLSLPYINFSRIEQQLIPKNIESINKASSLRRRSASIFVKKKKDEEVACVNISKEMFSMITFESGMFFSKQDGDRVYQQLVEIQQDKLNIPDTLLNPETLKKFLSWFRTINQFNQYSTFRLRKIESFSEVPSSLLADQESHKHVVLTQSTFCKASFFFSKISSLDDSVRSDSLIQVDENTKTGRICFCNDGSIYFGISRLELVLSDMSQILKIDHYPPQNMLKQQPDLLHLTIEGIVKIVIKMDQDNCRVVEFKFPTTIQSLKWYSHFLSLMNFSTSMTMNLIMSKKQNVQSVPTNPTTVSIFRNITIDHVLYMMNSAYQ
ncbi:predicted protein [Naegleria gruberi]|uniref:Predicted protein n=1 Tax=Naegleria gruberi TaxID=5762 RepID=D2VAZ6_NAEGR|nr:uncharacterized protein NAEGRDRAFT_66034 [Naegleria gruberi]EFC46169.1 predicted protein [Naegleria gruberi]|eukprot:XP_002678913.1 predicted protein [Naegleria gruberi strain NEG-M]